MRGAHSRLAALRRSYGEVEEPEVDTNQGFLEFGREAPRKLAFISPGIKMRDERPHMSLGRTRSRTPNSDIGSDK